MIRPGRDQQIADIFARQAIGFVAEYFARRFAGAAHHRQRARQLPVPGLERVPARAAIAELVAVVAASNDMNEPAWRHGVGIVIHSEDAAEYIAADAEWVPEAGRHAPQLLPLSGTPEDAPAFAASYQCGAVGADQLVRCPQVLAESEKQIALGVESQAGNPIVRIIAFRIEKNNATLLICFAVAIAILQAQDLVARGQIHRAIRMHGDVHRRFRTFEKSREAIRLAIAIGILDDADTIMFWPLVILRTEVRVTLDDQQPAALIEGHTDGVNDLRRRDKEIDAQAQIGSLGSLLSPERTRWPCADEGENQRNKKKAFHRFAWGCCVFGDCPITSLFSREPQASVGVLPRSPAARG